MADAGFVWISEGWLVGWFPAQLRSWHVPSMCDCFVSVSGLTPLVRAEEETGFCCLHCKKGSYVDFCFMIVEIRNKMAVSLCQLPSSLTSSVAGTLTPSKQ